MTAIGGRRAALATIAGVVLVATGLRVYNLGESSFWFDEVVTMRLAETPTPAAMIRLLAQIDATRAPLHSLLLQGWLRTFGNSEAAARALSVLFGLATVALMFPLGRLAFDGPTGRWSAWLGAISPLLVYYSREVRMYAPLVFLTTLAWTLLFRIREGGSSTKSPLSQGEGSRAAAGEGRRSAEGMPGALAAPPEAISTSPTTLTRPFGPPSPGGRGGLGAGPILYATTLAAMLVTHPLGLIMWGTLASASMLDARRVFGSWRAWLAAHVAPVVLTSPLLVGYFDHPPEFLTGRLPIKFLLGTPIGFLGGDFRTLGAMTALVAFGLWKRLGASTRDWVAPAWLIAWLVLPPTALYAYSWVANPIFGPSRYTLFCAPAFLVLLAQGLAKLPAIPRWPAGAGMTILAFATLPGLAYDPSARADWRGFAEYLAAERVREPDLRPVVYVASASRPNVEVETARYYLEEVADVRDFASFTPTDPAEPDGRATFVAAGVRSAAEVPPLLGDSITASPVVWARGPVVHRLPGPGRPATPAAPARERPGR